MSDKIILEMTTAEIVAVYNKISKIQVQKFRDRKTAELRLHGLVLQNEIGLLKAMKSAKVNPKLVAKLEEEMKITIQPEIPAKSPEKPKKEAKASPKPTQSSEGQQAPSKPGWEAASQPLLQLQAQLKAKELEKAGVEYTPQRPNRKKTIEPGARSKAMDVLWHLQNFMKSLKEAAKDEVATSSDVTRMANLGIKDAIKQLDILASSGYISIEDDSVGGGDQFYYVTLTEKGIKADTWKAEVESPRKTKKEPRQKKEGNTPRASKADKAGKKIYKLVKENPRREGTCGWHSFNLVKNGIAYEDYIELGGRNQDLQWDIDHQFLELK